MKKIIAAALAFVMIVAQTSCGKNSDSDSDGDHIYGQIESISGNDVVIRIAEYNEKSDDSDSGDDTASDSDSSGSKRSRGNFDPKDFSGSMPDGFDPEQFKGKRPSGSDDPDNSDSSGSRKRPSMPEGLDGSLPDGFDPKNFDGSMPEGFSRPDKASRSGNKKSSGNYTITDETQELRIPVGVTVTTSKGVKSGFDALKKGDIIKCSVEKDSDGNYTVKEVRIMEQ